jgi:hypothetical protein
LRFRARASGWRGSALAGKQLKEAVGAITAVAKSDPELSGGEIVFLSPLYDIFIGVG